MSHFGSCINVPVERIRMLKASERIWRSRLVKTMLLELECAYTSSEKFS